MVEPPNVAGPGKTSLLPPPPLDGPDGSQGRRPSDGGYIGILPKSGQVNFLWSNNDDTVTELIPQ